MAEKVVLMCDKCGSDDRVQKFGIGMNGATPYEVDLCHRCGEPVQSLAELGRRRAAGVLPGATMASTREPELRSKVYSPEELDRMEEEYRRKHKK